VCLTERATVTTRGNRTSNTNQLATLPVGDLPTLNFAYDSHFALKNKYRKVCNFEQTNEKIVSRL